MSTQMRFLTLAAVVSLLSGVQAQAGPASNTAELLRALKRAAPGAVIQLAPGSYSGVVIVGFHGAATITSANRSHPAVLTDLAIQNSSGLTLHDLELSTETDPIGPYGAEATIPFKVTGSSHITLARLNVHGALHGSLATDLSGIIVRDGDHIEVSDSDFHNLHNALAHLNITSLIVRNNHFHLLRDDGLRGGGSSDVLVEGNHCDNNHPDATDPDHPDCIQFWTSGTKIAAHDITIRGNTYERGSGGATQGIFLRDEMTTLPFRHVDISDNVIKGAQYNGISIFGATDVHIANNIVCEYSGQASWIIVRVVNSAKLLNNQASKFNYIKSTAISEVRNKTDAICPKTR